LAHSQLGWLAFCQVAEFTGAYGVSFLLVWGAAVAAEVWHRRRQALPVAGVCALIVLANVGWGYWRIGRVEAASAARPKLTVLLVQPGGRGEEMPDRLRRMSLAQCERADLVVWGEGSIGYFADDLASFHDVEQVRRAARFESPDPRPCTGLQRPLLCGGGSFAPGAAAKGPYCNTAHLIAADERIVGRYHKRVLMPWGEYAVGQQWLPGLHGLLGEVDPWVAGNSAAPLDLNPQARLGVLICYEDLLPQSARETVQSGANVLINLNNLQTWGGTIAPLQHQLLARFRTIENRRWLVRCGTVGSTAVLSATGRVERQAPLSQPATLVASVPLLESRTVYTRYGDVFAMVCAVIGAALIVRQAAAHWWPRKATASTVPSVEAAEA
ncbi:MAG TPA: apolipoprotein N-acyltransferase, partial [Pirellulaceae bacterium]|nr:apolipoprotein N-acyltransferase [Pirellulaceae bacterium]